MKTESQLKPLDYVKPPIEICILMLKLALEKKDVRYVEAAKLKLIISQKLIKAQKLTP